MLDMLEGRRAVIFDLDGTLMDSMWMWRDIDIEYLGRYGYTPPKGLEKVIEGMGFTETAQYFKERFALPDSIEKVGYKAFYRCSNLKKLTVGKNVTKMFAHAFCQNKKLKKIVFKGTKRMRLEKPHVFINVKNAKVYVPRSRYTTYKKLLCAYGLKKCKFVKQ